MGNPVRQVDSTSTDPLLNIVCREVNSVVGNNVVLHTTIVGRAACKSADGSFGRSVVCRESNSIFRVTVYSRNKNVLPFP